MNSLKHSPMKFNSLALANSFADKAGWVVMLGDDCRFWVVCFADAAKLERAGYEFAN